MRESHARVGDTDTQSVDMTAELTAANQAGNGLAWTGGVLALLWWVGAGFGLFALNAQSPFSDQPSGFFVAGLGLAVLPGLILLFAGFTVRQNKRAHDTNLLILKASNQLLSPTRAASNEMKTLAESTRHSTAAINQVSTAALVSLKQVTKEMETERLRAESVGYAMADNARDLVLRLSEERIALEAISRSLSEQTALIGDALPKQANAMKAATVEASKEVAQADAVFTSRIEELKQASSTLATRLIDLDAVARDAANRTETLQATISRIEDKLGKSQRTVEMAERASTLAVDAAAQTGEALKDAVSAALDSARDANKEIADKTQLIQDTSLRAMAELRQTGAQAASAAARVQEQSLGIASSEAEHISELAHANGTSHNSVAEAPLQTRPEQDPMPVLRSRKSPTITEVNLKPSAKRALRTRRVYTDEIDPIEETRPQAEDADLFDNSSPVTASAIPEDAAPDQPKITTPPPLMEDLDETPPLELGNETSPILLNQTHKTSTNPTKNGKPAPEPTEWRDIIADIGNPPEEASGAPREATADELISRLQNSGIPLGKAFRSRDKKKIAIAARKDDDARRRAIRNVAGGEVDRVTVRLTKDDKLMRLAQRFVSVEQAEALKALEETGGSGRHASPRLSAYLLVDAALDPIVRS